LNSDDLEEQAINVSAILQEYSPSQEPDFLTPFSQRPPPGPTSEQVHGFAKSTTPTFAPVVVSEATTSITSIPLFSLFSTPSPKSTTTSHSGIELDWSNLGLSHPAPFIPQSSAPPMATTTTKGLMNPLTNLQAYNTAPTTTTFVQAAPSNIFTPSFAPHTSAAAVSVVPDFEPMTIIGQSRAPPPMSPSAPPVSSGEFYLHIIPLKHNG
jgi:hypothetical protein